MSKGREGVCSLKGGAHNKIRLDRKCRGQGKMGRKRGRGMVQRERGRYGASEINGIGKN